VPAPQIQAEQEEPAPGLSVASAVKQYPEAHSAQSKNGPVPQSPNFPHGNDGGKQSAQV